MTCSNAARRRSASARARSRSPRCTSMTSNSSDTRYSNSRDRCTVASTTARRLANRARVSSSGCLLGTAKRAFSVASIAGRRSCSRRACASSACAASASGPTVGACAANRSIRSWSTLTASGDVSRVRFRIAAAIAARRRTGATAESWVGCGSCVLSVEHQPCAQETDIGQRILQERVAALEALRQFLLLCDRCSQAIDWSSIEALALRVGTKPGDRVLDRLHGLDEGVVVAK